MTRRFPDVNKDGVLCEACDLRHKAELMVPDELWKKVSKGQDFLCGMCIMARLEELNESFCLITKRVGDFKSPRSWRFESATVYRTPDY